jgi:peptidoglycan/xylan/chitin deacetylase (PgdA/CDA1 family)
MKTLHKLFLTFDTEDFISESAAPTLQRLLTLLQEYNIHAVFFITGHMAEKISKFPRIVTLLEQHEIGYHTSSHSVHPTLFEYTDVESYEDAYKAALLRETSSINPLTGAVEGRGGIHLLRDLFPQKRIVAFRAPGHCWSPPHLEALKSLGIVYDFSTNLSPKPISYKGITFYPYPILGQWTGTSAEYRLLLLSLRKAYSVLTMHPNLIANKSEWDLIYRKSNPETLSQPPHRSTTETESLTSKIELLFKRLKQLQRINLVEVTPVLQESEKILDTHQIDINACYKHSMRWAYQHEYTPSFLYGHFLKFFDMPINETSSTLDQS